MTYSNQVEYHISSVSEQTKNKDRYSIYVNKKYYGSLSKEIFYKYDFVEGDLIDIELLNDAIHEDKVKRAYIKCLNLISYRPRSLFEIRMYLKKNKNSQVVRESVIERLLKEDYINDENFARDWIDDRIKFKKYSRFRIFYELKNKGIEDKIINNLLEKFYPANLEIIIGRKKAEKYARERHLDLTSNRIKIMRYLNQNGFTNETIRNIFGDYG